MSRYIDADALKQQVESPYTEYPIMIQIRKALKDFIDDAPSIDIVRCAECKHRPIKEDADGAVHGFNVIAPNRDERCPCLVEDGWYSWLPDDNFYCGYGERREV